MNRKRIYYFLGTIVTILLCGFIYYLFTGGITLKDSKGQVILGRKPGKANMSIDGPYILENNGLYDIVQVSEDNGSFSIEKKNVNTPDEKQLNCIVDSRQMESFKVQIRDEYMDSSVYVAPTRLLAISDIEGNFFALQKLLLSNGVINSSFEWTFGDSHLVAAGDMLDRGRNVTQCLWLLYKLEEEALKHNGRVHIINGNHEEMNFRGNMSYVQPKYRALANELDIEHVRFFENCLPGGWLKNKNIVVKIGNILFCHGGISKDILEYKPTIEQMNNLAKLNFGVEKKLVAGKGGIEAMLFSSRGPMWYRGYFADNDDYKQATQDDIDQICQYFEVDRIVVGHTVQEDISANYRGKVIGIDIIHPAEDEDGVCKALLVEHGVFYKVSSDGKKQVLF